MPQTIETVVAGFHHAPPQAAIYVYDNNTTDGTAECAGSVKVIFQRAWESSCACFLNEESNVCFSVAQRCFLWYNNLRNIIPFPLTKME